jgi:hypothetical protein
LYRICVPRPAAFLLLAAACGYGRPRTYPVTGTVTVNGIPASGADVTLHPSGAEWADRWQQRPFGKVRGDGTFVLSTFALEDGAPAGDYVVTLYWPDRGGDTDRLGGAHARPDRPEPLRITVRPAANPLDAIKLTASSRPGR